MEMKMEIKFDREQLRRYAGVMQTPSAPDELVEKKERMLRDLGEFIGAEAVEYQDGGNRELYTIRKNGRVMTMRVCMATHPQEAWLHVEVEG